MMDIQNKINITMKMLYPKILNAARIIFLMRLKFQLKNKKICLINHMKEKEKNNLMIIKNMEKRIF
jgi:hypothetical protein